MRGGTVSTYIDGETYDRLDEYCSVTQMSRTKVIQDAIKEYLASKTENAKLEGKS